MYETYVTVVGRIITTPEKRRTLEGHSVVTFRMASNERRFRDGEWGDGDSLYLAVTCWRTAADNVHMSLLRGDPVIVRGRLRTREFVDKEGNRRSVVDMEAQAIGPDLFHATARVQRAPRSDTSLAVLDPWSEALAAGGGTAGAGAHVPGGDGTPDATHREAETEADATDEYAPAEAEEAPAGRMVGSGGAVSIDPETRAREAVDAVFDDVGADDPTGPRVAPRRSRSAASARGRTHDGKAANDPTEAAVGS